MKRMMGGAAILAAAMALTPPQIDAQQGRRARNGADRTRGAGIEMIMRMQDRLELSESQMNELDVIRREGVERRSAHQAQVSELRSQVAAGLLEASAFREQMKARQEGADAIREQQRERVEALLTDGQREQLEELGARNRAFRAGRASAMRDGRPGSRGGRAAMRGGMDFRRQVPGMRGGAQRFRDRAPAFRGDPGPDFRGRHPLRRGRPPEESSPG